MNKFFFWTRSYVQHYNHEKYWAMRDYLQNWSLTGGLFRKLKGIVYLIRVKRMDAFACASTGISLDDNSAFFATPPRLPHGLYGIIIAPGAKIGKNVRICQQVTIGNDYKDKRNVPIIGDNVEIYPGAKIIGKVTIGNNVKIGANAVVFQNIPDNATVVVDKPRIILKETTQMTGYEI